LVVIVKVSWVIIGGGWERRSVKRQRGVIEPGFGGGDETVQVHTVDSDGVVPLGRVVLA
jgi:hypothetical protein